MANTFCTQCGANLLPDARFCAACGQRIGAVRASRCAAAPLDRWAPRAGGRPPWSPWPAWRSGSGRARRRRPTPRRRAASRRRARPAMPEGHPPVEVPGRRAQGDRQDGRRGQAEAGRRRSVAAARLRAVPRRAGRPRLSRRRDQATYTHILERQPENLDALRALGNIAFDRNDPTRAMEYYRRYLKIKPDDLGVQTDLAHDACSSTKQVDAALKAIRRCSPSTRSSSRRSSTSPSPTAPRATTQGVGGAARAREIAERRRDPPARRRTARARRRSRRRRRRQPRTRRSRRRPRAAAAATCTARSRRSSAPIRSSGRSSTASNGPSDDRARVLLREFPMDGMPPMVREKFTDRIRSGVRDRPRRASSGDRGGDRRARRCASGRVMETVTE